MHTNQWPEIWIGSVTDQDLGSKVAAPRKLEDLLNKRLRLADYGTAIQELRFVFIAVKPENTKHPDDEKYASRLRRLTIWRNIDYPKALKADTEELTALVVEKLLESIKEIPSFGIRSFDEKAFHRDLLQTLKEEDGFERAVA